MTRNINDFITIHRQKNGQVKIRHNITNEGKIYKLLHELGYRTTKLNNKRFYYRRESGKLTISNIWDIKKAFLDLLVNADFTNIPTDIEYSKITNWFFERHPIKVNGLFEHYLEIKSHYISKM